MRLSQLLENTRLQGDNQALSVDELAVELHFMLVSVRPFPNGNGRHSRMMADLPTMSLSSEPFTWGAQADLTQVGDSRARYLQGIYDARDTDEVDSLLVFARTEGKTASGGQTQSGISGVTRPKARAVPLLLRPIALCDGAGPCGFSDRLSKTSTYNDKSGPMMPTSSQSGVSVLQSAARRS